MRSAGQGVLERGGATGCESARVMTSSVPARACTGYDSATGPSNQTETVVPGRRSSTLAEMLAFAWKIRVERSTVTSAFALPDRSFGTASTRMLIRRDPSTTLVVARVI